MSDWHRLLRGAFAFETAPFGSHPCDERRALEAIAMAIRAGASRMDIEDEICEYLSSKKYNPERIPDQIRIFRKFFSKQYMEIRNCWILSRPIENRKTFISIFSGRKPIDDILYYCMHIYQTLEYNDATQFMRAKKKRWPTFQIKFHRFESGGLWEGRASIGSNPEYLLEKADATLRRNWIQILTLCGIRYPSPMTPVPPGKGFAFAANDRAYRALILLVL